jgi:protein-S-isoprenylcysteine O-methyltransferase Ste14
MVAMIVIRAPYLWRNARVKVVESRKSLPERMVMVGVAVGMLGLPLLAMTPYLAFANYSLHPLSLAAGSLVLLGALVLFWRSHADLGTNWSLWMEVRESHYLVTTGVYARVRHPMYASLFLICLAQGLLIANWVAGPAGLLSFLAVYSMRVGAEERLMLDRFGETYRTYMRSTGRVWPRSGAGTFAA